MTSLIIDGHNLLYASFFGMPERIKSVKGEPIQAVYGFTARLLKMIRKFAPKSVVVCFDAEQNHSRAELLSSYKANRPVLKNEQNPFTQYGDILRMLDFLRIKHLESVGVEADDIMGAFAILLSAFGEVYIASQDKDMLQLVRENIFVYSSGFGKEVIFDGDEVKRRYGVLPIQFIDFRALVGDTSDNIPGIPGIGPKTASKLINEYGSLEGIYANLNKHRPRIANLLKEHRERVFNFQQILAVKTDVELKYSVENLHLEYGHKLSQMSVKYVLGELGLFPRIPFQESFIS